MFIPLGPNCHPAGVLKKLNLRKFSYPFDWLSCNPSSRVFEYVNDLITTNFDNFTTNLSYNHRGKVISKNYDYVEFYHCDIIKNRRLITIMDNRGKRFMDIISDENNNVTFLCMLHHTVLKDGLINNHKLYEDMINFNTNINIKCKFKVLVYFYNDNNDYNLILPKNLRI